MNKYQVIWLIIRLAGVYFAYLTLLSLFSVIGAAPDLFTLPKLDTTPKNTAVSTNPGIRVQPIPMGGNYNANGNSNTAENGEETITDKFKREAVKIFAWYVLLTALYGAAAWYLLRDGRLFYELLNREEPNSREKEKEVTTLNLSERARPKIAEKEPEVTSLNLSGPAEPVEREKAEQITTPELKDEKPDNLEKEVAGANPLDQEEPVIVENEKEVMIPRISDQPEPNDLEKGTETATTDFSDKQN